MNRTALLHIAALTAFPILATGASAAPMFGPLDFESSGQFDDNFFVSFTAGGGSAYQTDPNDDGEPNNDYLRIPGTDTNGAAAVVVINTSPGTKSLSTADSFGSAFKLTFDLAMNMTDANLDAILFDPSSSSNNLIVNIRTTYSANESVGFARDGNIHATDSGLWKSFPDTTVTSDVLPVVDDATAAEGLNFTPVAITYEVNPGEDAGATLTVEIGSFSTTLTLPDNEHVIASPAIAFRNRSYNVVDPPHAWRIDNIAVVPVPEPGMIGLLPAVGVLAMRRRRGDC